MTMNNRKMMKAMLLMVLVLGILFIPTMETKAASQNAYVNKGGHITLKVNEKHDKVTWTSANKTIATVSNGKVYGKKAGKTTITAKVGSKRYYWNLTVRK